MQGLLVWVVQEVSRRLARVWDFPVAARPQMSDITILKAVLMASYWDAFRRRS